MSKVIIVYHQVNGAIDCPDGICAAWIAHKYYASIGKTCEVVGESYLNDSEYDDSFKFPFDGEGNPIVLCDFSYPYRIMEKLLSRSLSVVVLDHHASRLKDISALGTRIMGGYSASDCGATFAWKYFFPDQPEPWFLLHTLRRDIGKDGYYDGKVPESEAIATAMSHRRKGLVGLNAFPVFDRLLQSSEEELMDEGYQLLQERDILCSQELALYQGELMEIAGYKVPFLRINNPQADKYYSVIGSQFARKFPEFPFVAIVTSNEPHKISLRSRSESPINCGEIAASLGGGGHKNAAGFSL